jgi:hypothetical protein
LVWYNKILQKLQQLMLNYFLATTPYVQMSLYYECFQHFEFKVGGALPPESFLFLVVTQALALPNATSHCCRSCEVAALK